MDAVGDAVAREREGLSISPCGKVVRDDDGWLVRG
jgi:hypothetical protein